MTPLNISGPKLAIRETAQAFAERMGKTPVFTGEESSHCWLVNCDAANRLLGPPGTSLETMIGWVADWVSRDLPSLDKPTAYDSRDGSF